MVPQGPLANLLLLHIKEGHSVLCESIGKDQPLLFMTRAGNGFDDVTFPQWWASFFDSQWGPPSDVTYFPPNKGRTLFVKHYMATTGNHPEDWEGAAYAMGNSTKQWREHYAPQMRDRLAQDAVNSHQQWRAGGKEREEPQQREWRPSPPSSTRHVPQNAPSPQPTQINTPQSCSHLPVSHVYMAKAHVLPPKATKRMYESGVDLKGAHEQPPRAKPRVWGAAQGVKTQQYNPQVESQSDVEIVDREVDVIVISDDD
jgi:hypothetical protein